MNGLMYEFVGSVDNGLMTTITLRRGDSVIEICMLNEEAYSMGRDLIDNSGLMVCDGYCHEMCGDY